MAWLKVIISYFVIAGMESIMDDKWSNEMAQYSFEIAMSVLFAGWIAHSGW